MTTLVYHGGVFYSDSMVVTETKNKLRESMRLMTLTDNTLPDIPRTFIALAPENHKPKFCFPKHLYTGKARITGMAVTGNLELLDTAMALKRRTDIRKLIARLPSNSTASVLVTTERGGRGMKMMFDNTNMVSPFSGKDFESLLTSNIETNSLALKNFLFEVEIPFIKNVLIEEVTIHHKDEMVYFTNSEQINNSTLTMPLLQWVTKWYNKFGPDHMKDFFTPFDLLSLAMATDCGNGGLVHYGTCAEDIKTMNVTDRANTVLTKFHTVKIIADLIKKEVPPEDLLISKALGNDHPQVYTLLNDFIRQKGCFGKKEVDSSTKEKPVKSKPRRKS